MLKKTLGIIGIVLLVLIVGAFAAPYLFKGKIIAFAKKEINDKLNAKVDFSDVDISLFRHFPKVSVALKDISVAGTGPFAADTLISAKNIDVALNLMSVIRGSGYTIYSVNLDEPSVHAIVLKTGETNWNITKPDTSKSAPGEAKPLQMHLQSYSIRNGYIRYDDASSGMNTEISGLNHSGSGDFTSEQFTLSTKTTADAVSFRYGAIPWLNKAKTSIDADLQVDNKANKYSFTTNRIAVNDLLLSTEGFFQLANDSTYNMDIKFNAPSTDFKHILSLVPVVYQKDFAKVKTSGQALFNGFVKGVYSNKQVPAYNINLDVKNGVFQYPDLPKPVQNINLSLKVDNPDGVTDHTVVNIPAGHIELDKDPFDFRLMLKNPVSNMFVDAAAKGKIDLSQVAQLVKLESGTKLSGLLNADVSVNGLVNAIQQQQYDKFNAAGAINLANFLYASKDYPGGIKLSSVLANFTPRNVTLSNLAGEYLGTRFTANGTIDNLLPYVIKNKPLTGTLNLKADQVNLNDWMGTSADTAAKGAAAAPFVVPANLNLTLNALVDKLHYDKLDLQNLSGALAVNDETVSLRNIKSQALDGNFNVSGSYSTKENKKQPAITLNYDVKGLDVQKTFAAFNTVQKLMPIGQFLGGKISSQLSMTGRLGDNMMPDLNTLTGQGNLLLLEGFLRKFAPLDKLASTLSLKGFENISLKDVKNYIEFANGKMMVKPFTVKVNGIEMEIGGVQGIDQSIAYGINLKVPRAMMGDQGNALVNNLVSQVNNKGVPVKIGDVVNFKVNMGGTLTNPQLKTELKQSATSLADDMKQQATEFAKAKIDSTKKALKDTVSSLKHQLIKDAKGELVKQLTGSQGHADSSAAPAGNPVENAKKKAEEAGKGLLNNFFKKKNNPASDTSHKGN